MATLGIKNVKLALVDKTGTVITGANGILKMLKIHLVFSQLIKTQLKVLQPLHYQD
ncbi:phage tail protein [Leuconostoc citreum]|uniref:phage tail protein n=1 Tax=Leuconostoc citreum TaxID=33964 RepID=UPI0012BA55CD|nr:phage tail protein [Leuconostoc citreum]QGN59894.1 hypothetical protein GJ636_00060 [Leuconostoc citreum]